MVNMCTQEFIYIKFEQIISKFRIILYIIEKNELWFNRTFVVTMETFCHYLFIFRVVYICKLY